MLFRTLKTKLIAKIFILITLLTLVLSGAYYLIYKYRFLGEIKPLYFSIIMVDIGIIYLISFYIFISKPFSIILLQIKALLTGRRYNKIYTERIDEIGVVAHFFNEMTKSLEKVSSDIKDKKRMSQELDIASRIQKQIMPEQSPNLKDLTVIAKSKSAAEIGGDCFDFIPNGDNTFFFIGDSTGHGTASGLVMMMVHTLISTFCNMNNTAFDVIFLTNKYLKPLLNSIMFMTMTMFRFNHKEKKMYCVGAGHEHVIIYKNADKDCLVEKSGGIALGMIPDNSKIISERELPFEKGDTLVVYTDGITEAKNIYGELFRLNRLVDIVKQNAGKHTIEELLDEITKELNNFTENHIQEDDMSLIICKYGQEQIVSPESRMVAWDFNKM